MNAEIATLRVEALKYLRESKETIATTIFKQKLWDCFKVAV
jgi:hypothetical protein